MIDAAQPGGDGGGGSGGGATALEHYRKSYNIGPGRYHPVFVESAPDEWEICMMRWGLVPHFQTQPTDYATLLRTINARSDTVRAGSPVWTRPRESRRCIVPAQGFFEWQKRGKDRVPYYIYPSTDPADSPFQVSLDQPDPPVLFFAGLWEEARTPAPPGSGGGGTAAAPPTRTFAIVTTESEGTPLAWLHDRMPVLLTTWADCAVWLDRSRRFAGAVDALLRPTFSGLRWHRVDVFVNRVGNDSPECVVPARQKKGTLFRFLKPPGGGSGSGVGGSGGGGGVGSGGGVE
ncbi:hypothetical protein DFJ73DRAFT_651832, partial [Zopfochytrium polystomum]